MSVNMTIQGVSNNVQALLNGSGYFRTVLPYAPTGDSDFTGFPAASHYYVDTESSYATVSQNRRVFQYVVEVYLIVPDAVSETTRYSKIYSLIDNVIQLFDQSIDLSSTSLSLSPACDIMRPTPGELSKIQTKDGPGFMATFRLFTEADITFRNS